MRHVRLISAAVGALFVTAAATGCSSDDVKSAAKGKVDQAKAVASSKAGQLAKEKGGELLDKKAGAVLDKLSPENKKKLESALKTAGVKIDEADPKAKDEPAVTVAEEYFAARTAALKTRDLSAIKQIATPKMTKQAKGYVRKHAGHPGKPFKIKVVGVTDQGTNLCVGPKGQRPRVVTLNGAGLVAGIKKGTQSCA